MAHGGKRAGAGRRRKTDAEVVADGGSVPEIVRGPAPAGVTSAIAVHDHAACHRELEKLRLDVSELKKSGATPDRHAWWRRFERDEGDGDAARAAVSGDLLSWRIGLPDRGRAAL
jgi:hypothetical protein